MKTGILALHFNQSNLPRLVQNRLCSTNGKFRNNSFFKRTEDFQRVKIPESLLFVLSFIVDSMPLEVCKLSRSSRSKICKEVRYARPNKGYCAAQGTTYYGYKLHAICSVSGVFHSIDLSPASVHDIHYLKDIKQQISDCTLIGDKGYLSAQVQLDLFESCNI